MKRKAFTLIEVLISISILSIMMLFLYKSYANLNLSNNHLRDNLKLIKTLQDTRQIIYMDFLLANNKTVHIEHIDKNIDIIIFQSSNSIHRRFQPYIRYIVDNSNLYRIESLNKDITQDEYLNIDFMTRVKKLKLYKSLKENTKHYLLYLQDMKNSDILLKI